MRIIGNNPAADNAEITAVASGTLPSGKTVVVNADGTVSVVGESTSPADVGSKVVFEGAVQSAGSTYDTNSNKVVFCYMDDANSDYGTAIVGTVSGTTISFGTPVVYSSISTLQIHAAFDSFNNKVVISYYKNNVDTKHCVVGTVSGTDISFGTEVQYATTGTNNSITFDSSNNKIVVLYRDGGNSHRATAKVGTVSGTDISFGSAVVFMTGYCTYINATFDSSNNKVVVVCADYNASYKMKVFVGTVSGTSISFGSEANISNDTSTEAYLGITFDTTNNKTVVAYRDSGNSGYATAAVGTVSGTSISFGTPVVLTSAATSSGVDGPHLAFNSTAGKVGALISENSSGNMDLYFYPLTVSGTTISAGDRLVVDTFVSGVGNHSDFTMTYDPDANKFAMMYSDKTGGNAYGASRIISMTAIVSNLTAENFIGFAGGVVGVTETLSEAIGTPVTYYTTAGTAYNAATFDSNSNKFVVSFRGQGDDGTSVVGTVNSSNNSISFGSPAIWNTNESIYINSTFDSNSNKVVVVYRDEGNSSHGTAVVGTVSGTSISFGTPVVFEAAAIDFCDVTFDSSNNKVVIAYRDRGNSFYGTSIVGTVSGTSISFGSPVVFNSNSTVYNSITFDSSSNKAVIFYFNLGSATNGTGIVGTVSGTNISFGTPAQFESGNIDMVSSTFDSNSNKTVVTYRDEGNSNYGTVAVGTVSGTNISFGTPVVFEAAGVDKTATTFDSNANKVNIFYEDAGNSAYGTVIVGTVSGTSISFGSPVVFQSSTTGQFAAAFDSNSNRAVGAYANEGSSSHGTAVVVRNAGVYPVTVQVASGSNAVIDIGSAISTNQSGLTAGQQYFVQADGTLGLTAGSPSVIAGTAVSATDIIVKG